MSIFSRKHKRFVQSGTAIDVETVYRLEGSVLDIIEEQMRHKGYVPVLDKVPECYTSYNPEKETFEFEIAAYGIYVGKKKAQGVVGVFGGLLITPDGGM